jgi:hypothetical protein
VGEPEWQSEEFGLYLVVVRKDFENFKKCPL